MSLYKVRDPIPGTPYVVMRFIGAGGMGSVYEVEDTSIGKRYVLKTLKVGVASRREASGLEQMMRREARALAQLSHPHIVDVITAGKTADRYGLPFIVMEKLDGVTVRTMLQSLRFPRQSVWQISNELLDALYHLHHPEEERPPMLHRDIKPENIFLAKKRDKKYVTKLLDLGIAVLLDGQAHGVHGTPAYMAPEQLRNEPLTEHTDLYQAACVIFEMLTGRHPYYGAKSVSEWIDAHLWRDVPRVSDFVDVPKRVDDMLFAALSKDPSKRPRDAHAFMAGLHSLRDESDDVAPVVANTTVEDLHTAIEKRGESGYLAYATGVGVLEHVAQPGPGSPANAHPEFAVASTAHLLRPPHGPRPQGTVPRHKGLTVPMEAPRGRFDAGRVDRAAPTRSLREPSFLRAQGGGDTEQLPPPSGGEERRSLHPVAPRDGEPGVTSSPLVAETGPSPEPSNFGRRGPGGASTTAIVASALILVTGILGASFVLRAGDALPFATGSRAAAPAAAAPSPTTASDPAAPSIAPVTATNSDGSELGVPDGAPAATAASSAEGAPAARADVAARPAVASASSSEGIDAARPAVATKASANVSSKRLDAKPAESSIPAPIASSSKAPSTSPSVPSVKTKYEFVEDLHGGFSSSKAPSTSPSRPSSSSSSSPTRPRPRPDVDLIRTL